MGIEAKFNKVVDIRRPVEEDSDAAGTDFTFDDGTGTSQPTTLVISNYPCTIKETIGYDTGEEGSRYTGKAKMTGILTDKIQEGDIVAGKFKVMGEPEQDYKLRYTVCNLVRL